VLELLKSNFILVLYGITLVLSVWRLPKYFDSNLKFLPIIIGYIFCTEILGYLVSVYDDFSFIPSNENYSSYTLVIYNIYDLFFFTFFYYVYWKTITSKKIKQTIKYGGILFLISFVTNILFKNMLTNEMWYAYIIGGLILIIAILAYLSSVLFKPNITRHSTNLLFWISIGLLVFHLGYVPITLIKNAGLNLRLEHYHLLKNIQLVLILFTYSCFIIGFLKMHRMKPIEEEK